jgi:hypothetical protein
MDDIKKVTEHIEYLFINKILQGLSGDTLKIPEAKNLAIAFKAIEPFTSIEDAKQKMELFASEYPTFIKMKEYVDASHSDAHVNEKINHMRDLMRDEKIDEAIQVAKA